MDNILHLIGIAKKAGRLEVGEEPVGAAARSRKARVILVASDAAENTIRRVGHFAEAGNIVSLVTPYTKAELGTAIGRSSCAMVAVTDAGLAAAMVAKLAAADPQRYATAAEGLNQKAEKVLKRQKEQRQHEKNLQRSKNKPWAAPGQKSGAEGRLARKPGEQKAPPSSHPARRADGAPKPPRWVARPSATGLPGGETPARPAIKAKSTPHGGDHKYGKPTGFQGKGANGPTTKRREASSDVKKHR